LTENFAGENMSTAVVETPQITPQEPTRVEPFITVTEKAASEVLRIVADHKASDPNTNLFLRVRVVGGGCSGFQNKLDLEHTVNPKTDEIFEVHGITVVVDKRSKLYIAGATVDFHDDLNKRGFSITNPQAKSTCGCGSSYSM
jgi:iron-sulfur cluster assembly accessory protein